MQYTEYYIPYISYSISDTTYLLIIYHTISLYLYYFIIKTYHQRHNKYTCIFHKKLWYLYCISCFPKSTPVHHQIYPFLSDYVLSVFAICIHPVFWCVRRSYCQKQIFCNSVLKTLCILLQPLLQCCTGALSEKHPPFPVLSGPFLFGVSFASTGNLCYVHQSFFSIIT